MDNGCTVEYGTIRSRRLPGQWQNIYCWRLLLVCKALHQSYSGTIFDSHAKYTILKLKLYDLLKYTILGILELYDHFPGISWSFNRNLRKWQYTIREWSYTFSQDRMFSVTIDSLPTNRFFLFSKTRMKFNWFLDLQCWRWHMGTRRQFATWSSRPTTLYINTSSSSYSLNCAKMLPISENMLLHLLYIFIWALHQLNCNLKRFAKIRMQFFLSCSFLS